jgi:hypothetical protein
MILFLDIDGVLHPEPATAEQAFCCRHLLWEILLSQPVLQVVIASDWRINHSLDYLIEQITEGSPVDLKHRFVGVTPFLPEAKHVYRGRERECMAWLAQHNTELAPWFALDDVAGNFTFGISQLHLVDYRTGLTEADVSKILTEDSFEVSEDCLTGHVTPANGNIFLDLGFPPEEAAQLKAESDKQIAFELAKRKNQDK